MEVKQSEKSESAKDLSASLSGSAKFGPVKVNITGSVSSHESNTRSSDNSAKYHVDVRASNHGTPEGLSRVLDMMAVCISPVLVSSDIKDGNGQSLSDAAKQKAENLKRLRAEIRGLETRLDASKNSLDNVIQRMKNTAIAQENAYQAQCTRLLNGLDRTKAEDDAKADSYSSAMDQVLRDIIETYSDVQGNPIIALEKILQNDLPSSWVDDGADGVPFPRLSNIIETIAADTPLIACVAGSKPNKGKRNLNVKDGHWVIIAGVEYPQDDESIQSKDYGFLYVIDPAVGHLEFVEYNKSQYLSDENLGRYLYWQNTSYINVKKY